MAPLRATVLIVCLALLHCVGAVLAAGPEPVNVALKAPSIDLLPFVQFYESDKPVMSVPLPGDGAGQSVLMPIDGRGSGPIYHWAVVSFANPDGAPGGVVLSIPHQGFVWSGVLWPQAPGTHVVALTTPQGVLPEVLRSLDQNAYRFTVEPGKTLTFAVEINRPRLGEVRLWREAAFDQAEINSTFLSGATLGIAMLLGLVMLALYTVRTSPAFLAGALFAIAATLRLALEEGYLPVLRKALPQAASSGVFLTAASESLMLTGLVACLITFPELRKRLAVVGNLMLGFAGLSLALPVYGWFEPLRAMGLARIGFAAMVVLGFALMLLLWRRGFSRAQASLPSWSMLVLWTFLAAIGANITADQRYFGPIVSVGLVLVLLTMAFTLAQFAFSHGFVSRRFFEESGRRALALAGAQEYVWDWQVAAQELHVSAEIERALAIRPGYLTETGLQGFLDLLHPLDRTPYEAAVRNAERRGKGVFSLEFRLRRGDGAYRWYKLKARAMQTADRRTQRCIGTLSDITNNKRSEDRLLRDAVFDRVTGLPNRALLTDRISRAIASVGAGAIHDLRLLLIDLDRFKTFNDGLGHETGDGILNVTGRRLQALAGPEDTVARMPGDQFAVLFSGEHKRDIVMFTEDVRREITRPIDARPREIYLTACIGVAGYTRRGETADDLLKNAAVALYEAKKRGPNSVDYFHEAMRDDRGELITLESDLRRAIERNEIEVLYQPIARIADMDLAGFEALVRWRHHEMGLLVPQSFIPLAEQTGLIIELGRHVLNEAGRQLGVWQRAFRPADPLFVSVNISASQLATADLIGEVRTLLAREALRPGTLKIEVTESAVMENPEHAAKVLEKLQALGVGLACDDFGTGYSSLSNLRSLPFDTLKIDKSFIDPDPEDARAQVILATVIDLAHDLGLSVIAEGIENQDRIDALGAMGCDYGQGFFIGPPMTAKQVVDALSGLPYATGLGKTVIAALLERATAQPAPAPTEKLPHFQPKHEPWPAPVLPPPPEPQPEPEPELQPEPEREASPDTAQPPVPRAGRAPMAPRLPRPPDPEPVPEPVATIEAFVPESLPALPRREPFPSLAWGPDELPETKVEAAPAKSKPARKKAAAKKVAAKKPRKK